MANTQGRSLDELEGMLRIFQLSGNSELTPCCDLGEYVGPVEIFATDSMSMGYGLRVTRRAAKGEILLIGKAIASCVREYQICSRRELDPESKTIFGQPFVVDADSAVSAEGEDHSDTFDVDELHHANERRVPAEVSEQLILGIKQWLTSSARAYQILCLQNNMYDRDGWYSHAHPATWFYAYNLPIPQHLQEAPSEKIFRVLYEQKRYLPGLIARNASYDDVSWSEHPTNSESDYQLKDAEFWGLWLLPSFINHSCAPNCMRQRVGDYLIIRASTNIEPNQMLTLPYFNVFKPISVRNKSSKQWGFRCSCSRCTLERGLKNPQLLDMETFLIRTNMLLEVAWRDPEIPSDVDVQLLEEMGSCAMEIDDLLERTGSKKVADPDKSSAEEREQHPSESATGEAELDAERNFEQSDHDILQSPSEKGASASEHSDSPEGRKARRAAKKKKKKAEQKELKKTQQLSETKGKNETAFKDRLFIEDEANRKDTKRAEELIRSIYVNAARVAAGESEEILAAIKHWGHTDSNPFDKMWASINVDYLEQDFRSNPLSYYIKASYIDAYIAAHSLETTRASLTESTADATVSRITTVNFLLDMLNAISVTSGYAALSDELVIDLNLNCNMLLLTLPEGAPVVITNIVSRVQHYMQLLAEKFFGFSVR